MYNIRYFNCKIAAYRKLKELDDGNKVSRFYDDRKVPLLVDSPENEESNSFIMENLKMLPTLDQKVFKEQALRYLSFFFANQKKEDDITGQRSNKFINI
jgi:hypothetical protein